MNDVAHSLFMSNMSRDQVRMNGIVAYSREMEEQWRS